MWRSRTNWHTECISSNEDDYYPDCRTPPSPSQKSHTIDADVFKTTSITSNSENQPLDTWEVTTASLKASIHCGNLESSESNWCTKRVTDIEDNDHEYKHSYNPIAREQQPKHLQWTKWPYPGMPQYWNPNAEWRDDSLVSSVTATVLPIEWSTFISVCM